MENILSRQILTFFLFDPFENNICSSSLQIKFSASSQNLSIENKLYLVCAHLRELIKNVKIERHFQTHLLDF